METPASFTRITGGVDRLEDDLITAKMLWVIINSQRYLWYYFAKMKL